MKKQIIVFFAILLITGCGLLSPPPPPLARDNVNPPPQANTIDKAQPEQAPVEAEVSTPAGGFTLTSPVVKNGGKLPATFTCDGQSLSPPLAWQGAPEGTVGYALAMHHVPGPDDTHWYWVVYNILPTTLFVEAGTTNFGTFGINSVNGEQEYAPPCSKGPGEKLYTITVYALSAAPNLPNPAAVDRDTLLAAIADITLVSASMDVTYERGQAEGAAPESVEEDIQQTAGGEADCDPQGVFAPYVDRVYVSCNDTYLYVET